jgi:hypothetical protein
MLSAAYRGDTYPRATEMNNCVVCRYDVEVQAPEWSGGRLKVNCSHCGRYEIGPKLYKELLLLPEDHWMVERVRSGMASTPEPRIIWKPSNNLVEVGPAGADKPSDLRKRFLRSKSEGKLQTLGTIVCTDDANDEPST